MQNLTLFVYLHLRATGSFIFPAVKLLLRPDGDTKTDMREVAAGKSPARASQTGVTPPSRRGVFHA